jgi:hypothetical protein
MPTEVIRDTFGTLEMHKISYILKITIYPYSKME